MHKSFLIAALFLSGCATTSICDYDLAGNNWYSISKPPENLRTKKNGNSLWFKNAEGDFLACPELVRRDVCGIHYELYEKKPDGSHEYFEILCMQ